MNKEKKASRPMMTVSLNGAQLTKGFVMQLWEQGKINSRRHLFKGNLEISGMTSPLLC